jgi:LysR family transcriptional regulator, nitrogen assimilation regulatory protein
MIIVNRYGASSARGEDVLAVVDTFLVGKPDHPGCKGKAISFRDLAGLPLVLPSTPNGLRSTLDHLSREQGITLNIVMEVDTPTAMKDVAVSGHARTILPLLAIKEEQHAGVLTGIRIEKPAIKRTISLGFNGQRPLSKAARFVGKRLRELATGLLEG